MHRYIAVAVAFAAFLLAAAPASKPAVDPDHVVLKSFGNHFQMTVPKTWELQPPEGVPNQLDLRIPTTQPSAVLSRGLSIHGYAQTPRVTIETCRASVMNTRLMVVRDEAVDVGGAPARMFVLDYSVTPTAIDAHGQHVGGTPVPMRKVNIYVLRRPWSLSIFFGGPKDQFDEVQKLYWPVLHSFQYLELPANDAGTVFRDVKHEDEFRVPSGWEFSKTRSNETSRIYTRNPDATPVMALDQLEVAVAPAEKSWDLEATAKAIAGEVKSKSPDAEIVSDVPSTLGGIPARSLTYTGTDGAQKTITTCTFALKDGQRYQIRLTCDAQRADICAGAFQRTVASFRWAN